MLILIAAISANIGFGAETNCTVLQALEKYRRVTISDGASYYSFSNDHSFSSGPVGLSGRTLSGTWKMTGDGRFTVIAEWGWVNGVSQPGDFRRIVFVIYDVRKEQKSKGAISWLPPGSDIFEGYYYIDEFTTTTERPDPPKAR